MMDGKVTGCLRNILDYLEEQEQTHFEEHFLTSSGHHIYEEVIVVKRWLDGKPGQKRREE